MLTFPYTENALQLRQSSQIAEGCVSGHHLPDALFKPGPEPALRGGLAQNPSQIKAQRLSILQAESMAHPYRKGIWDVKDSTYDSGHRLKAHSQAEKAKQWIKPFLTASFMGCEPGKDSTLTPYCTPKVLCCKPRNPNLNPVQANSSAI